MVSIMFGGLSTTEPAPSDEKVVRSTATPVNPEKPAAMEDTVPEWNDTDTDPDPNLGLEHRDLASHWVDSEQYRPGWIGQADAEHNAIINRQIASSGTAAARENAGEFGHGTMPYAVGIEPVIREGAAFGGDYFVSNERDIQEAATPEWGVQPSTQPRGAELSGVYGYARDATRAAAEAAATAAWMAGGLNG